MENNLPAIKPNSPVKARYDILKHEDNSQAVYNPRIFASSFSKKGLGDVRTRSLAEVRGKLKSGNNSATARYAK